MKKFNKGDLVHVAKDLGPSMRHFTADIDAIVIGSYNDLYGGGCTRDYSLHLKGHGKVSWYHENQLELLERNRGDLLATWEAEQEAERKQKADLDWIFENGPEVLSSAHGASIEALGKCVGMTNLWGSHGEGFIYMQNAFAILSVAAPFLESRNKAGWLELCQSAQRRSEKP